MVDKQSLKFEKLKFKYEFLRYVHNEHLWIITLLLGSGTISIIKGTTLFNIIGAILYLIGIWEIISGIRGNHQDMLKIYKKINEV